METTQPLAGVTVLDLSQGVAGPYCGLLLAEHGARVLKVEPPQGDWSRSLGPQVGDASALALYYNRGKKGLVLDLKTDAGRDAALALAARADVLIENARPGALERLGLGFEQVRAVNDAVIYLSVSGYGLDGPKTNKPMADTVGQGFSGLMSLNRGRDGRPHKIDITIVDAVAGLFAFQSVLTSLMARAAGDRQARRLDVSLMQSAAALLGPNVIEYARKGAMPAKLNPPAGAYACADGFIAFTLTKEAHFAGLAEALGHPEWPQDPRFATFAARVENLAPLAAMMDEIFAAEPTAHWLARLEQTGVIATRVNDFGDWLADDQVQAVAAAPAVDYRGTELPTPRTPGRAAFAADAPRIGEHAAQILAEFGLSEDLDPGARGDD